MIVLRFDSLDDFKLSEKKANTFIDTTTISIQSMSFPNKAQHSDMRQSLPPLTGIYPTMNMMLTGKQMATISLIF